MSRSGSRDHDFVRNTAGISSAEFFWGLGLPVVMESTFLPLFLAHAGASNFIIGLVPTLLFFGVSVCPLFSSYLTEPFKKKKTANIVLHMFSGLSIMLYGFILLFLPEGSSLLIPSFLIIYTLFSCCIGLTVPVWKNYIIKIFSPEKGVAALSVMQITQSLSKIGASYLLALTVNHYSFSIQSSSYIFLSVGLLFFIGSFGFLLTREEEDRGGKPRKKLLNHLWTNLKMILSDRNYLLFLGNDLEMYAVITAISFYANYAVHLCGISPAVAAGYFTGANYAGNIICNLLLGWQGFFTLKNKALLSKLFAASGILLLITMKSTAGFLMASFLFGLSKATQMLISVPGTKLITGKEDITAYMAMSALITMPFSMGLPLFSGLLLDSIPGISGYKTVFSLLLLIIVLSTFLISRADFRAPLQNRG